MDVLMYSVRPFISPEVNNPKIISFFFPAARITIIRDLPVYSEVDYSYRQPLTDIPSPLRTLKTCLHLFSRIQNRNFAIGLL